MGHTIGFIFKKKFPCIPVTYGKKKYNEFKNIKRFQILSFKFSFPTIIFFIIRHWYAKKLVFENKTDSVTLISIQLEQTIFENKTNSYRKRNQSLIFFFRQQLKK